VLTKIKSSATVNQKTDESTNNSSIITDNYICITMWHF